MGTLALPAKGAEFEPPPAGAHIAVCYRVIDLGTQDGSYKGKANKKHLVLISWEIPDELMQDGRPFTISKRYTLSSSKKARLRGDLESWRGRAFEDSEFGTFDIGKLIGAGCMLNVVHEEKDDTTYANVATIMRLPKGTKAPTPKNETLCFSLDTYDEHEFSKLSEKLRDTIMKSPEYKKAMGQWIGDEPASNGHYEPGSLDDEIPF